MHNQQPTWLQHVSNMEHEQASAHPSSEPFFAALRQKGCEGWNIMRMYTHVWNSQRAGLSKLHLCSSKLRSRQACLEHSTTFISTMFENMCRDRKHLYIFKYYALYVLVYMCVRVCKYQVQVQWCTDLMMLVAFCNTSVRMPQVCFIICFVFVNASWRLCVDALYYKYM